MTVQEFCFTNLITHPIWLALRKRSMYKWKYAYRLTSYSCYWCECSVSCILKMLTRIRWLINALACIIMNYRGKKLHHVSLLFLCAAWWAYVNKVDFKKKKPWLTAKLIVYIAVSPISIYKFCSQQHLQVVKSHARLFSKCQMMQLTAIKKYYVV